jgi:hypothetical protein
MPHHADLRRARGPELRIVLAAAQTLRHDARELFLQGVAAALVNCRELGEGVVHRAVCRVLQDREVFGARKVRL